MKQNITYLNGGGFKCSKFKSCGGCGYDIPYMEELERKQTKVNLLLSRFGKVAPIAAMETPYGYRSKVSRVFKKADNKVLLSGVYKSNSGGCIPVRSCALEDKRASELAYKIADVLGKLKYAPFDHKTGRGDIRQILIRTAHRTGEVLLCIVTPRAELKNKSALTTALKTNYPYISTCVQNICSSPLPLSLGDRDIILFGKGYIEDIICGKRFCISPRSFMQVNPVQAERLYSAAKELLKPCDTLLDAYCGTGTIGLICSEKTKKLYGAEIVSSAVKDARKNAKINNIQNTEFFCCDSKDLMMDCVKNRTHIDSVILDPPRAGASRAFLNALCELSPKQVIYISCAPDTLARDLRVLKSAGYCAEVIIPFDMFPRTPHVETVVLMSKVKG